MASKLQSIKSIRIDQLQVQIYKNRKDLGTAAAEDVVMKIIELQKKQEIIRIVFAAAPSQNEFLAELAQAKGIDWKRITVFHMDEYIGLPEDAVQSFGGFLRRRLFDLVSPGEVNYINSLNSNSIEAECERYTKLLKENAIDIVCLGIGENGHVAFNDPPVADFQDPRWVKSVELDELCRQQQVNDDCFPSIEAVPTHALTMTIPALMSGAYLYCMVPGKTKRNAVRRALTGPINTECPASILRQHPACTLYVDIDSFEEQEF